MPKRVLTGTVVSDKGDKTVVVRVERRVKHPLYGKIIKLSKKYHAHDAANEFHVGEIVRIEECAPISKLKTWTVRRPHRRRQGGGGRDRRAGSADRRTSAAGEAGRGKGREEARRRSRRRRPRPKTSPKRTPEKNLRG